MSGAVRTPGAAQGWTLVALAWLSVVAGVVIAPVLPTIAHVFAADPQIAVKIPLVATLPALMCALLGAVMGAVAARVGRKRLLLIAVTFYGLAGTAPLWLTSLDSIVASRALVGFAEAAVMTCATVLIGDYFEGRARERWLALQTGTAPLVATVLLLAGGALGAIGWRVPFAVYGYAFLLIPLVLVFLWEPAVRSEPVRQADEPKIQFRWLPQIGIDLLTVFAMSAFIVTIVQFGFVMTARGVPSPALIGLWAAAAALANAGGSALFAVTRWRLPVRLGFAFGMLAVGFAVMALGPGYQSAIVGVIIASIGCGYVLPTLITWALSQLPARQRATGTGLWIASSFLGQFISPLAILAFTGLVGSLDGAILCYAAACLVVAIVLPLWLSAKGNGVGEASSHSKPTPGSRAEP